MIKLICSDCNGVLDHLETYINFEKWLIENNK
jgi:hypothetical protein